MIKLYKTDTVAADKILKLLIERQALIKKHEDSWDESLEEYKEETSPKVDTMGAKVLKLIVKHANSLPIDFSIEALTHLGWDIVMIYDDNGNFAFTYSDWSNVRMAEDDDYQFSASVNGRHFKKTIREAFIDFIERDE